MQTRLDELNLNHLAAKGSHLERGRRRRFEITRALALNPSFLLLDEPFSGGPHQCQQATYRHWSRDAGMGIFLTDHNVRETLRVVDRAYLLYEGKVLAHGDSKFLLADPETWEKYGHDFIA